jgi:flavin reductase (DIM6/NTAB) family NADH-FMN oxidoreductase RutF
MNLLPLPDDPAELRRGYGCFPTGVTAICAMDAGRPRGMAASSFTAVSLDPPLVSICIQNSSTTWPHLRRLPRLGITVLAEGQDGVCRSLAARGTDRFAGVDWDRTPEGAILLDSAAAWLDCSIHQQLPAGDHVIVLLRVHAMRGDPARSPLVFHGSAFHRLAVPA